MCRRSPVSDAEYPVTPGDHNRQQINDAAYLKRREAFVN